LYSYEHLYAGDKKRDLFFYGFYDLTGARNSRSLLLKEGFSELDRFFVCIEKGHAIGTHPKVFFELGVGLRAQFPVNEIEQEVCCVPACYRL
jgi:hypothetical protein